MSATPFLVFPWQRPFLPALKDHLNEITQGRPGSALLLVPHNRPWRYLVQHYAADGYTGLLPKVMTLSDAVASWRAFDSFAPLHTANTLDRVALLHQCINDLARDDSSLAARFARMDMALFLPWGLRLAALLLVAACWFLRFRNNFRHASAGHKAKPAGAVGASGDDCLGRRTIGWQFAAKTATRACNIHKKTPSLAGKTRRMIPRHSSRSPQCWQVPPQPQCVHNRKIGLWCGFDA